MSPALTPLKVLFLTTPAKGGASLAAQSFVEEEIRALRTFGVQPFVLTDEIAGETIVDGVRSPGCRAAAQRRRQGRRGWGSVTSRCCKGCCAPAALRARSFTCSGSKTRPHA